MSLCKFWGTVLPSQGEDMLVLRYLSYLKSKTGKVSQLSNSPFSISLKKISGLLVSYSGGEGF